MPTDSTAIEGVYIPEKFRNLGHIREVIDGSRSKVVYLRDTRSYALKIHICHSEEELQAAIKEVRILYALYDSGYAVRIFDYDILQIQDSVMVYILEECLPSLLEYQNSDHYSSVSENEKLIISSGIAEALHDCYSRGIAHLDVKPSNLFIDGTRKIKLGDFDVSMPLFELRNQKTPFRKTYRYTAPEVYSGGIPGEISDIYSAGLVIYGLFYSLDSMYGEESKESCFNHRMREGVPDLSHPLPYGMKQILEAACAYRPSDRYQTFNEMARDLRLISNMNRISPHTKYMRESQIINDIGIDDTEDYALAKSVAQSNEASPSSKSSMGDYLRKWMDAVREHKESSFNNNTVQERRSTSNIGAEYSRADNDEENTSDSWKNMAADSPALTMSDWLCDQERTSGEVSRLANPAVDLRKVQFSVLAPDKLQKDTYSIIDIMMYEETFRREVDELIKNSVARISETKSGLFRAPVGSMIKVVLRSKDIEIEENEIAQVWSGGYLRFGFAIELPDDYTKKQVLFRADIYFENVILTTITFVVKCDASARQVPELIRKDIMSAFMSYASQDRRKVAMIVEGMKKVRPDLDIFFDVASLQSGDAWNIRLQEEIIRRDILFLCWSRNARNSLWVNKEWRLAYSEKGEEGVEPIPLETPDVCPPPDELQSKHFNDIMLFFAKSDENIVSGPDGRNNPIIS